MHFLHSLKLVSLKISVMSLHNTFTTGLPNSGNRQSTSHSAEKKAEKYVILEEKFGYSSLFWFGFFFLRFNSLVPLKFKKVYKNLWSNTRLQSRRQKKLRMQSHFIIPVCCGHPGTLAAQLAKRTKPPCKL